ncbi:hypothetical protein ACPA0F_18330 [Solibacillus silvestris]
MTKTQEITQNKVLVRAQMKAALREMTSTDPSTEKYALLNEEYETLRNEYLELTSEWMEAKSDERELALA